MRFGVCYYPEHYSSAERRERMIEDIALLKEMQMNVVRIMEFAWCEMEPEEGKYRFEWLDEIIELLGEHGISSLLCTPTAAPPRWLTQKYPEALYVNPLGERRRSGARRYTCYNNPQYVEKSEAIAAKMAKRYGNHPYVMGFMIDNELAQEENGRCCCPACRQLFQEWLMKKYESVEKLNDAWHTIFWGQKYQDFAQIETPAYVHHAAEYAAPFYPGVDSPSLRLNFERFCSERLVRYFEAQEKAMRPYTDKPITTNATGVGNNAIDYPQLFQKADLYAYDIYPSLNQEDKTSSSFSHAFARTIKKGKRGFWILETYAGGGHGNWAHHGIEQGEPGTYRNNVLHAYASGAELVTPFKMHVFQGGFEQLGSALMDLDRFKRRRFYEFKETGERLVRWEPLLRRSKVEAKAALCFDYESLWSMEIKPIAEHFSYVAHCERYFRALRMLGLNVDVVTAGNALDEYQLLVLPCMTILTDDYKEKIREFVQNGGIVAASFLTGSKDEDGNGKAESMPYGLTELFGMRVGEQDYLGDTERRILFSKSDSGTGQWKTSATTEKSEEKERSPERQWELRGSIWAEELELCGAEAIGVYEDGFRQGKPLMTRHGFGKGKTYYIGTELALEDLTVVLEEVAQEVSLERFPFLQDSRVEVVERTDGENRYYFLFNNAAESVSLTYTGKGARDWETGEQIQHNIELQARGCCVVWE